jgi:hypothetical protein
MIVSESKKIILITPPKCATHSIVKYLNDADIKTDKLTINVNYPIYHLRLSEICKVYDISYNELNKYKIIQCIRNPYNRMVSSWLHQSILLNKKIDFLELLNKLKETKYLIPNNIDTFYKNFYGNIGYKNKSFKDGHWGGLRFYFEQNCFNDMNANIQYFKIETLKNSTKSLSDFLNIETKPFPHENKNKFNKEQNSYDKFYNKDSINIVNELYENDIKIFDYKFINNI